MGTVSEGVNTTKLLILLLILFITGIQSCYDLPSLSDIEQMNDRTPPDFIIEYPADGDVYDDIIRSRGMVIDNQESENQEERIETVVYSVDENGTPRNLL